MPGLISRSLPGTSTEESGNDGGTNAGTGEPANSGTASPTGPLSPQTKNYVLHSEMSDKFEIARSKLALTRSEDPKIKDFAKHMISDHGLSTSKLHKLTLKDHMDVATSPKLDAEHTQLLAKLKSEKGKTFDQTYLQAQSDGHLDALTLQQAYASTGGGGYVPIDWLHGLVEPSG